MISRGACNSIYNSMYIAHRWESMNHRTGGVHSTTTHAYGMVYICLRTVLNMLNQPYSKAAQYDLVTIIIHVFSLMSWPSVMITLVLNNSYIMICDSSRDDVVRWV